jgi:hypothetical protein
MISQAKILLYVLDFVPTIVFGFFFILLNKV